MVEGTTPLVGERGAVRVLDVFEGRRQLIAYHFMWRRASRGGAMRGIIWVTSQVSELSYIHSRDITYAVFCQGPVRRERPLPRLLGLGDALVLSPGGTLDTLLVGRRVGLMYIVCYLQEGSNVFGTYWTTRRGVEAMDNTYRLIDLTVYGREDPLAGWPQRIAGKQATRTNGRPTAQWSRLTEGHSDDLGTRGL